MSSNTHPSLAPRTRADVDTALPNLNAGVDCQSCGRTYTAGPIDGAYSTVWGSGPDDHHTTDFRLCPECALQLVFEIGRGLPTAHFDVMAEVVEHEIARRREREAA